MKKLTASREEASQYSENLETSWKGTESVSVTGFDATGGGVGLPADLEKVEVTKVLFGIEEEAKPTLKRFAPLSMDKIR